MNKLFMSGEIIDEHAMKNWVQLRIPIVPESVKINPDSVEIWIHEINIDRDESNKTETDISELLHRFQLLQKHLKHIQANIGDCINALKEAKRL